MLAIQNVIIDDTVKPAIEWVHGKAVQKLMPTDVHGILQLVFGEFLRAWIKATHQPGKVASEWRFIIPPNSFETESLVPDVAYLSTYFDLPKEERTYPKIPPDIAVEILSPGDDEREVASRRELFLWWGVKLVLIVDPEARIVEYHESDTYSGKLGANETFVSLAFPTLSIPLQPIFVELDEP